MFLFQIPYLYEYKFKENNFAILKQTVAGKNPKSFTIHDIKRLEQAWGEENAINSMMGYYRFLVQNRFFYFGYSEDQFMIHHPALFISGLHDTALVWENVESGAKKYCKNGYDFKLYNTTHWIQHEESERFNNDLENFIKRN
jgi:pimeloyl-ACP methyl ester carboxylesterase